jgi:putative ABC transport system permease protein
MTLEKLHEIALLKLMGARESVVVSLIGQQAAFIAAAGYVFAIALSWLIFPLFPRRVLMLPSDLAQIAFALALIAAAAAWVGVARASRVSAREVLS